MGMVWVARLADDAEAATIFEDQSLAYEFINPEDEAAYDKDAVLDLDKEWHALHFLLTGSADPLDSPLSLILSSSEPIGDDNGYGPTYYIAPDRFRAFDEALSSLDDEALRSRYDPDAMVAHHVYLADLYQEEGESGLAFLLQRLKDLRSFAAKGVQSGRGAFWMIT